jgi:hypothetical protein
VEAEVVVAGELILDLARRRLDARVVVNLVGQEAPEGDRAFTADYLAYLADIETPTVNGLDAFVVGSSPARRLALLDHLGAAHPPARVVADRRSIGRALADLGLESQQAIIREGPPVVVQARADVGEVVRVDYVADRAVRAAVDDEAVRVDDAVARLGSDIVRTAGIEFGGVSFGVDHTTHRTLCVGVDTNLADHPEVLDAVAEHVLRRGGLPHTI